MTIPRKIRKGAWLPVGILLGLIGCGGGKAYIVEGVVVGPPSDRQVVLDHEEVKGLMGAMTMPFEVRDPRLLEGILPGDRVIARLRIEQEGSYLAHIRVVGHEEPVVRSDVGPEPLEPGQNLPRFEILVDDGSTWVIGEDQGVPTAVAFVYTRCPLPEYCSALVGRFLGLQEAVSPDVRLLTVTLDPEYDTLDVLRAFAAKTGAHPETWRFGRVETPVLADLAARAALSVWKEGDRIIHGTRLLILDREGRLVERYDDNAWPRDRVAEQLRTGRPLAPPGTNGTLLPESVLNR